MEQVSIQPVDWSLFNERYGEATKQHSTHCRTVLHTRAETHRPSMYSSEYSVKSTQFSYDAKSNIAHTVATYPLHVTSECANDITFNFI